jgi:ESX secretion system ATPase EccB
MPAQPTTRWQVSGYRFLVRRMEHALVRRDVRMLHDPMRSQSRALTVGVVLACLGLAACGVLALLRPQDRIGDNKIVVGKDSGAMFVVLGDTVHPVMNLASARLAVGDASKPAIVKDSAITGRPRGPLVGIPGAPSALPFDSKGAGRTWTVCDTAGGSSASNSVLIGSLDSSGERAAPLSTGEALLLESGPDTYLVYDGKRAKINLDDRAVTAALALGSVDPRPASAGLLNAIPEVPAIAPPKIEGAGSQPSYPISGLRIGAVVQIPRGESTQYYVVLRDGLQQISAATGDIIRSADSQGTTEITKIAPDVLSRAPVVTQLDVANFPQTAPTVVNPADKPVGCLSWSPIAGEADGADSAGGVVHAQISVLAGRGLPMADNARMVALAQADGSGTKADKAYFAPGSGAFLQTTGIAPTSARKDALFYVSDTGVRYGVADAKAAELLGLTGQPEPAPWPIVGLLSPGPTLGRDEALVAHDGVRPDAAPAALPSSGS